MSPPCEPIATKRKPGRDGLRRAFRYDVIYCGASSPVRPLLQQRHPLSLGIPTAVAGHLTPASMALATIQTELTFIWADPGPDYGRRNRKAGSQSYARAQALQASPPP